MIRHLASVALVASALFGASVGVAFSDTPEPIRAYRGIYFGM